MSKLINGKIYKEIDFEEILSSHNNIGSIYYHIFYGDVDWHQDGQLKKAICIFMRYDDKVNFRTPANILINDLKSVEDGIRNLKLRNNIT
jgi:hypothetical protein